MSQSPRTVFEHMGGTNAPECGATDSCFCQGDEGFNLISNTLCRAAFLICALALFEHKASDNGFMQGGMCATDGPKVTLLARTWVSDYRDCTAYISK